MRFGIDSTAMLIYITVVYVWGLYVYPLDRDFVHLKSQGILMPFGVKQLFVWEMNMFGDSLPGYHLVNLVLLYACMHCIYYLAPRLVKGPHWLGTLAATLFMANPVHTESVLNLSGVADLVPCLSALMAIVAYVVYRKKETALRFLCSMFFFMFSILAYSQNLGLVLVLVCYEWLLCESGQRRFAALIPYIVLSSVAYLLNASKLLWGHFTYQQIIVPLYFIFYPIGLLPENAQRLQEMPWLGWVAGGVVAGLLALLYRKVRRRAVLFGLFSAILVRLAQTEVPVDPVHLVGGGQLLLSNVFFNIALVTVFLHMMYHPKWAKPVVVITTWLCIAFFVMEIRTVFVWRYAGNEVRTFQQQAATQPATFSLLPDIRYYRGAPMCLAESVAYDTLFSRHHPVEPVLPLNVFTAFNRIACRAENWSLEGGDIVLKGKAIRDYLCPPYTLANPGGKEALHTVMLETTAVTPEELRIHVTPNTGRILAPLVVPSITR